MKPKDKQFDVDSKENTKTKTAAFLKTAAIYKIKSSYSQSGINAS